MEDKKIIFSGVQPSGNLTLGNYLGAIKNWVDIQKDYNCIYSMMDLHTITVRQTPADIRRRTLEVLALYIACGINPEETILFIQSHNPAHAELGWVLNWGELLLTARHAENINAGLFTYPVLMAADILLYQTDYENDQMQHIEICRDKTSMQHIAKCLHVMAADILLYQTDYVPVGKDQMQHIEICRDIAQRFNSLYGDVFKIPEGMLSKSGAKIMSLQEPEKKMSKSDPNPKGYISMMDDMNVIAKKIKSAVTDSEGVIEYRENDPTKAGINNLLSIMSAVTGRNIESIVKDYSGKGYGDFKNDVAEAVVECIRPIRNEYDKLIADKQYLMDICQRGADSAKRISQRTLKKVYKKVGFVL